MSINFKDRERLASIHDEIIDAIAEYFDAKALVDAEALRLDLPVADDSYRANTLLAYISAFGEVDGPAIAQAIIGTEA